MDQTDDHCNKGTTIFILLLRSWTFDSFASGNRVSSSNRFYFLTEIKKWYHQMQVDGEGNILEVYIQKI